jgi:3-deoxy-D-manno-octulosonic-acid transferase
VPSPTTSLLYRVTVRAGLGLAPALAHRKPKWRAALSARTAATAAWLAWAREYRDPSRPLLWMHAPSVGEGLQAEAVLLRLRDAHPDWQIVYTHTSPSAEALAERQPADGRGYLPWDRPRDLTPVLDALAPRAVVFAKLDLWPELATLAARRGAKVGMIAATVSPVSSRLRWLARALLRPGYAAVTRAGAIADDDAARLARLGVPASRIQVAGDPRFDSALARARTIRDDDPLRILGADAPTLIAGSTWPEDEALLLRAFVVIRRLRPTVRLILVPHEPTPEHLASIERAAATAGLPVPVRLSTTDGPAPLLVVDSTGLLARLYAAGTIAYVGGGLGRAGLHSVLEPAACGLPVLFGPSWQDSREAGLLLGARAAMTIEAHPESMAAAWAQWLTNQDDRKAAGDRALRVVEGGEGGAARNAEVVEELMQSSVLSPQSSGDRSEH